MIRRGFLAAMLGGITKALLPAFKFNTGIVSIKIVGNQTFVNGIPQHPMCSSDIMTIDIDHVGSNHKLNELKVVFYDECTIMKRTIKRK